jgi:hypothetical protein
LQGISGKRAKKVELIGWKTPNFESFESDLVAAQLET